MAETNKNITQQEVRGGKQVSVTHLIYLTIIFIILTILFWTLSLNSSGDALRLFSFASTITSIVLAVVSIVFSIFSGKNVDASLGSINKTSDDIRTVGNDIQKIGENFSEVSVNMQSVAEGIEKVNVQLNGEVEKISGLESNVKSILSSNQELNGRVGALLDAMHETQDNVKGLSELLSTPKKTESSRNDSQGNKTETFRRANYTIAARIMLYACSLTQQKNAPKSFPLDILLKERWNMYFYGYAYSLCGLLDTKVFDVEVKDEKILTVKKFDVSYFKSITKESLVEDMENSRKKKYMEERLKEIDDYFKENKDAK